MIFFLVFFAIYRLQYSSRSWQGRRHISSLQVPPRWYSASVHPTGTGIHLAGFVNSQILTYCMVMIPAVFGGL